MLTEEMKARIRELFPRYPTRQAVTLPALHIVNETLRCVPLQAMKEIAELLELTPAAVYDTMSFYGFFSQAPLGRHRVWVCRSISCAVRGGEEILAHAGRKLGVRPGQTSDDGRVTLEYAECLGLCDFAPAVLVGDVAEKNLTEEKMDLLLDSLT